MKFNINTATETEINSKTDELDKLSFEKRVSKLKQILKSVDENCKGENLSLLCYKYVQELDIIYTQD
jgi:hypothetical protein